VHAWNLLKVHCKVFFNWFYFYYWFNCRRHSKIVSVNLFSCDCSRWHCSDSVRVYTENYIGCMEDISVLWEKHEKHRSILRETKSQIIVWCVQIYLNLSQRGENIILNTSALWQKRKNVVKIEFKMHVFSSTIVSFILQVK
jgi:hypothetical protein